MALCVIESGGVLVLQSPQPSDTSTCAMVVSSGSELGNLPWNLTIEQAHEIGMSVFLACAIAWGFRVLAEVISKTDEGVDRV